MGTTSGNGVMMSNKTIQFGPFTPQELESLAREMQLKNIPFEITKDEDAEGEFKRIDYANVVNQVEFRTQQYMAQIFYITLAKTDVPKLSTQLEKLGFATLTTENPEELRVDSEAGVREDIFMKAQIEKKNFRRRQYAWLLILGLLCLMFLTYAISK
jgi:hypothetical protein